MAPDAKPKPKPKPKVTSTSTTTSISTTMPAPKPPVTTPSTPSTPTSQAQAASLLTAARKHSTNSSTTHPDFTEADLLSFEVCADRPSLVAAMNDLLRSQDFALLQSSSPSADVPASSKPITYRLRAEKSVKQLRNMSNDCKQLYAMIEGANSNGIWSKTLSMRSKLHQVNVTKALKGLEAAKLVKQMRSVRFPSRRLYLLSHLKPPSEATGGAWFTDGELDMEMIGGAERVALYFVEGRSWRSSVKPEARVLKEAERETREQERERIGGNEKEDEMLPKQQKNGVYWGESAYAPMVRKRRVMVPFERGYKEYPTASDVLTFMEQKGFLVGKDVNVPDVQVLLDMMVYDGRLEVMGMKKEMIDGVDEEEEDVEDEVDDKNVDEAGEGEAEKPDAAAEDSASGSDVERPAASRKRKRQAKADDEERAQKTGDPPLEDTHDEAASDSDANIIPTTEAPSRKRRKQSSRARSTDKVTKNETQLVPMYRSVRQPLGYDVQIGPGSALAETPCGRCPSFALCDDKGTINARSCEYWPQWLGRTL